MSTTTTTMVGTPDPDDHHHRTDADEAGRVIDFPTPTRTPEQAPGTGTSRDALPTVVDGEVLNTSVDTDGDDADEDAPRVLVDPPARSGRRELLPWQRREIERRPVIAPWLRQSDDVQAAARWAAGRAWHVTGFHTVRAPLYAARLAARSPRGIWVAS